MTRLIFIVDVELLEALFERPGSYSRDHSSRCGTSEL